MKKKNNTRENFDDVVEGVNENTPQKSSKQQSAIAELEAQLKSR